MKSEEFATAVRVKSEESKLPETRNLKTAIKREQARSAASNLKPERWVSSFLSVTLYQTFDFVEFIECLYGG